jgi:hypothetical protein
VRVLVALAAIAACKADRPPPSPAEIADRGWHAHELVVAAGERAQTCAEAGVAMRAVLAANRQAFVDAVALDQDRDRLRIATDWLEAHAQRYADLEPRMEALSERCGSDAAVQGVFREMESP